MAKHDESKADETKDAHKDEAPKGTPANDVKPPVGDGPAVSAHGAGMHPSVSVDGGKVTINHFHLAHVGIALGDQENATSQTHAPGTIRTVVFQAKDVAARRRLAQLLNSVAAQLHQ